MTTSTSSPLNDSDVRKLIWQGAIPIVFNVEASEITSLQNPFPLYTIVPRQSYLTLLIDVVRNHFEPFVSSFSKDDIWFEYDKQPLRWNIPVGVLFDVCMLHENAKEPNSRRVIVPKEIPWRVTVHFSAFPADQLVRIKSDTDIQWTYLNALKEATYVKCGNTKSIMTLSHIDQGKLWNSIKDSKLSEYEEIQQLVDQSTTRSYPVRVLTISENPPLISHQKLYCVDAQANQSLGDFISANIISSDSSSLDNFEIVIQGITPSLDTPLQWLVENCSHPDHFLYVCIQKRSS